MNKIDKIKIKEILNSKNVNLNLIYIFFLFLNGKKKIII